MALKSSKEDRIKVECTVKKILFFKNNWGIIACNIDKLIEGELKTDKDHTVMKGEIPTVIEGEQYKATCIFTTDARYGDQYNIEMFASNITLDTADQAGQRKFLESIFTKKQVEAMYEALENPYQAFIDQDTVSLCKIKGCGLKVCPSWLLKFKENYHRAIIYSELNDYNLSTYIIDKLLDRYSTPELVIEKVKNNPYTLVTEVKGIGWGIADKIAMASGMNEYDPNRISAFIIYYLREQGENGYSWITNDHLMGAILEQFGQDIPDPPITEAVQSLIKEDKLWFSDDKQRIGIKWFYTIERKIAENLIRLLKAPNKFKYDHWEEAVARIERLQGWEYTEEQKAGIKLALENNVVLIQGGAGTGKTSLVWAVIEILKNYDFVQCALSGKAASRLMEITGQEGYTIHRLLEYPKGDNNHGKFGFHEDNKMHHDIYIVDEVSMIDLNLFLHLIQAIEDGAKVIFLGDNGQLEAIGSGNIAFDLLYSDEIPSITLTKIHRQAERSAIITESVMIRNKQQIVKKDWVGHEVRGELQDLDLTCYGDSSNTYYKVMEQVQRYWALNKEVKNLQVLVPMKTKGSACTYILNNAIQELVNPSKKSVEETRLFMSKDMPYVLRVGDKVINTVNNYKVEPNIFNGNIGIIKSIWTNNETYEDFMTISFEGIGEVDLAYEFWRNIELAYAITVHKYQGSQSDTIIFGLDFNSYTLLSKELLYTGITRAKKKCYLIAQTSALRFGTGKSSVIDKQTHLKEQLYEVAHPKLIF